MIAPVGRRNTGSRGQQVHTSIPNQKNKKGGSVAAFFISGVVNCTFHGKYSPPESWEIMPILVACVDGEYKSCQEKTNIHHL